MKKKKLKTIEVIPFKDFKAKLKLIKENEGKSRISVISNTHLYIERWEYE